MKTIFTYAVTVKSYKPLLILLIMAFILTSSCKKGFLDERSNKSLIVPTTLEDFQSMLDEDNTMNSSTPSLGEIGCDDYYMNYTIWQAQNPVQRNAHIWAEDINALNTLGDWTFSYAQVYISNIVLDGLKKLDQSNTQQYNMVKGAALFYRANAMFNLVQIFASSYSSNAANELGIVLKKNSNVQEHYSRANLKETYDLILADVAEARALLPVQALYPTRPGKRAADALMARIYLAIEDYPKAFESANAALSSNSTLLDYNKLNPALSFPITNFNAEVIFHNTMSSPVLFGASKRLVDPDLYSSFDNNDLRRAIFFSATNGNIEFKGTYSGSPIFFTGLANDELFLIRAECNARGKKVPEAMADLNTLLLSRWKTGTYIPMTAVDDKDALSKVLTERRKELQTRGVRWSDLRRLNKDVRFQKSIVRQLNGVSYTLAPNDKRYVWPIPQEEVTLMGLVQNPR